MKRALRPDDLMEIYLLRHGIAEDGRPGERDSDRALTKEGRDKLRAVLRRVRAAGVEPKLILSSPYRRAIETAEIARKTLRVEEPLVATDALTPMSTPERAWDEIRAFKEVPQLLLVGHEPLFSALFAFLIGEPSAQIEMKKGAIGRVDVQRFHGQPRGILCWLLTPRLASAGV